MAWKPVKQGDKWFAEDEDSGELRPKKGLWSKSEALKFIRGMMDTAEMGKSTPKPPMMAENEPQMGGMGPKMPPTMPPTGGPAPSGPDMAGLMDILQKKAR